MSGSRRMSRPIKGTDRAWERRSLLVVCNYPGRNPRPLSARPFAAKLEHHVDKGINMKYAAAMTRFQYIYGL